MSEELKNEAAEQEPAGKEGGKARYANGLFPHACVHPYVNKDGEERAVVNLPAGTMIGDRDMTGFSTDVRMMPWMKEQIEAGDDVRVGFSVKWEPSLFKGRGENAEYVRVSPWDLVKGVKAAREDGSVTPNAFVTIPMEPDKVHRYQRTAQDGKTYEKAIVDLPGGLKTDVFLRPWMAKQHEEGKTVNLSFKANENVELFKGEGEDRITIECDPTKLKAEVLDARKHEKAVEATKDGKESPQKKPSFAERTAKAQKASEGKEKAEEKKEPAKAKETEIGG